MDRGAWQATTLHGITELDTTEQLHTDTDTHTHTEFWYVYILLEMQNGTTT